MSSFYGDTTRLPMTPFYFDKIYNTESDMSADISNIFLNRYVLLKKTNDDGNTTGEVYQKQYIDNNEQFVLIASLTAPFTLTGDGGVIYDFNLDRKDNNGNIIKDYKTHNLYEDLSGDGKSANVQWLVGDNDQKYTLDIQLKEIGNALSEIYNALAGLSSASEGERPYNIIKFSNKQPVDNLIYPNCFYHLAYDIVLLKYYIIMPYYQVTTVSSRQEFEYLKNNGTLIFLYDVNLDKYTDIPQEFFDPHLDYYYYERMSMQHTLLDLNDIDNNIYSLIAQLNKLKNGEYPCDRNSLQGCIDYANWVVDQVQLLFSNVDEFLGVKIQHDNTSLENSHTWKSEIKYSTNSGSTETIESEDSFGIMGGTGIAVTTMSNDNNICKIELKKTLFDYSRQLDTPQQYRGSIENFSGQGFCSKSTEENKEVFEIYGKYKCTLPKNTNPFGEFYAYVPLKEILNNIRGLSKTLSNITIYYANITPIDNDICNVNSISFYNSGINLKFKDFSIINDDDSIAKFFECYFEIKGEVVAE